jgi:hypothetical protein
VDAYGELFLLNIQDMSSLVLHIKFFGSSTWAHILVFCLYNPSSANAIFV